MDEVRLIHYANESGSKEGIYITEDMEMPAEDCIPLDCKMISEQRIEMDTSGFCLETNLEKR